MTLYILALLCSPFLLLTTLANSLIPPTVVWNTATKEPSRNKNNDSIIGSGLPIGNGETVAYVFKLSPSDDRKPLPNASYFDLPIGVSFIVDMPEAMASDGSLFSLGMITLDTVPSMFASYNWETSFHQILNTSDASVTISTKSVSIKVWVDANTNLITASVTSTHPVGLEVQIQSLRPAGKRFTYPGNNLTTLNINTTFPTSLPDTFVTTENTISVSHRNDFEDKPAYFNDTLKQQGLGDIVDTLYAQGSDHWTNRQFGMICSGKGLISKKNSLNSKHMLVSSKFSTSFSLAITTLAKQTDDSTIFNNELNEQHNHHIESNDFYTKHLEHWKNFWDKSYIITKSNRKSNYSNVTKDPTPSLNRKYPLTRYLQSIQVQSGTKGGWVPIKFNGLCFTTKLPPTSMERDWGPNSWWQNTRLPYGSMLAQGDSDLYSNILEFILQMVPFAKLRTQLYFNHSGIFFIETKTLFGAYMAANYGTYFSDRTEKSVPYQYTLNSYLRYDFGGDGGTTEVANMVLDLFEHTNNITQLKRYMPLLMETLIFYDSHYEKTSDPITGKEKMYIFPTQALETYWCAWKNSSDLNNGTWVPPNQSNCVKNDHPTVVSLHVLAERSFRLLRNVSRDIWTPSLEALLLKLQQTLPDIPTIVENGTERTSPYENYPIDDELHNSETPELYGVHPFRYYTQGRQLLSNINISPAIQCLTNSTRATCTKNAMNNNGWTQGIMNAALLGLNNLTKNMLIQRVQTAPAIGYRFEAFAPHEQDYEPSADHYANMITAYQWMLLQPADDENGSIILFGAWPCEWDVEFKLHGPQNTIVEGVIKDGQVISLHVEPEERAKHVYNMLYC